MKHLLFIGLVMSAACLTACSDDDDNPIPQAPPRSMITEFVTPTSVYHEQSAFNAEFVANEDSSKIVGVRCLDFDITLAGTNIDFSTDPGLFVQELEEYGDTAASADIPAAASTYRPSTKPIRTITITTPKGNEHEDITDLFEVSYVSYYDFIKNGYSWNGIANPGPVYRMTLAQFNAAGDKKLVDTNTITLYIPKQYQGLPNAMSEVGSFVLPWFRIKTVYADGTSFTIDCTPVNFDMWDRLLGIRDRYNDGTFPVFPEWNILKSPKR